MNRIAHRRIGDADVTILTDGAGTFAPEQFPGTDPGRIAALVAGAIQTNFNAVLIRRGGRVILCDAGLRDLAGPACGHLPEGLAEAGVAPGAVDTLFATHLHPDHIAGMITAEGAAVFPAAELALTRAEHAFWSDPARTAALPATAQRNAALARAVLAAYADRLRLLAPGDEIALGLTVLDLPGHTPGHAGWRLDAGGAQLVHGGDIIHAPALQAADPGIAIVYDMDRPTARDTRLRLLDLLAAEGALFTGGHFLHPAFHVAVREGAGYRLERP